MNDIRVYDFELNLLHIEASILSSYWTLKYNDIGTLECTFPLSSKILNIILTNKYLIMTQGDLQAIITAYKIDTRLTVYAKTVNWILSKKTFKAFNTNSLVEKNEIDNKKGCTLIEHIFSNTFGNITFFDLVFLTKFEKNTEFEKTERCDFSFILKELLEEHNLGHRVYLDIPLKKWRLEIYSGIERPNILSESNRNLSNVEITDDMQNFYPSAWYNRELLDKGDYNTGNTLPGIELGAYYRINNPSGVAGKYPNGSYLVCINISRGWEVFSELPVMEEKIQGELSGIYDWDTVVSAGALNEAKTELSEKKHIHTTSGQAVKLNYGKDYNLGDIFKIQVIKGNHCETVKKCIEQVELWWENENIGEKLKFKGENINGI